MGEENYRLLSYQEAERLIKLHKDWVTRTPIHGGGDVYKIRVTLWHYEDGSTRLDSDSKKTIDDQFEYLLNG